MFNVRALDLYAGIGGWGLGLRLAGIDVVNSYEWWQPAVDTHNGNHAGNITATDVRKLSLEELPKDIQIVVGSPPCTEFSYANRGGSGNLVEGMKDLLKFFEVVDHYKPDWWAMENVPRVADVVRFGLKEPGHALYKFRHLSPLVEVIDFSNYGAAQARRRCIISNIPLTSIDAFRPKLPRRTLGDVVSAFQSPDVVIDPIWGATLAASRVTELHAEPSLAGEELRMNREAKAYHAVYNNMSFPDPLDQPSRTVTATCTRVSRESIIIANPVQTGEFRRLTIRERASLQGFPITYQFFGRSFAEKAKMIGNAIPPTFTYLIGLVATGAEPSEFGGFSDAAAKLSVPEKLPLVTPAEKAGRTYPKGRSFRAVLPGLGFKSGMRFELSNGPDRDRIDWKVRFFYGPSKDIREVDLSGRFLSEFSEIIDSGPEFAATRAAFQEAASDLTHADGQSLQAAWSRHGAGIDPFFVVDILGRLADEVLLGVESWAAQEGNAARAESVVLTSDPKDASPPGAGKLRRNALAVLSGFLVGDWFNAGRHGSVRALEHTSAD